MMMITGLRDEVYVRITIRTEESHQSLDQLLDRRYYWMRMPSSGEQLLLLGHDG